MNKRKYAYKTTNENGKTSVAYNKWSQMMHRCYDPVYLKDRPTYEGCEVCPEWHDFNTFARWFHQNYQAGFELDKDILSAGNKVYSPDTCVIVPHYINMLIRDLKPKHYMIGVKKIGNKYYAYYNGEYLGSYYTEKAAHEAYLDYKAEQIEKIASLALECEDIDWKVYDALLSHFPKVERVKVIQLSLFDLAI